MGALPDETTIGAVRLTVADPERQRAFYERAIGLEAVDGAEGGGAVRLGAPGGGALVELRPDPAAPERSHGTTGLFHLAILVPSRLDLARALRRVAEAGWTLTGASDHLVSEALYLHDTEWNGIEIYRDRPREHWPRTGDGAIQMDTLPLDLDDLLGELEADDGERRPMPAATRIGHVHLNVGELKDTERFYAAALGLDVVVRTYPGALFLSAGGYHHHVGTNTWQSRGGPAPPPGSRGLDRWELVLPDGSAVDAAAERLDAAGFTREPCPDGGFLATDPSGNRVLVAARG